MIGAADYTTFDGKMYSFQDSCMYTLLKLKSVTVSTQNIACGVGNAVCARKLDITVGTLKIEFARDIDLKVGGIAIQSGYYV